MKIQTSHSSHFQSHYNQLPAHVKQQLASPRPTTPAQLSATQPKLIKLAPPRRQPSGKPKKLIKKQQEPDMFTINDETKPAIPTKPLQQSASNLSRNSSRRQSNQITKFDPSPEPRHLPRQMTMPDLPHNTHDPIPKVAHNSEALSTATRPLFEASPPQIMGQQCKVEAIVHQLKTLFFYEDLQTLRKQIRLIVQTYEGIKTCAAPPPKAPLKESSRERLRQFLDPGKLIPKKVDPAPEELALKKSIQEIDQRLVQIQNSELNLELTLESKRSQSVKYSHRSPQYKNLQQQLVKLNQNETYELRHSFVKAFAQRLDMLEDLLQKRHLEFRELEVREKKVFEKEKHLLMPLQQKPMISTEPVLLDPQPQRPSPKFFIASPKPQQSPTTDHFSFQASETHHKRTSIISSMEDSPDDNFAEEYRAKQQAMLGELQSLYQEKSEWVDKLKSAVPNNSI